MSTTLQILTATLLLSGAKPLPTYDPPLVGRPDGFSNIVGKYKIEVAAEPTEVHVEEPITLTIRIVGAGPKKYEPDRKHLDLFPDWKDDFYVQEMRDQHQVLRDRTAWIFVYRLKPKHKGITEIAGIKLVTYDPSIRTKNKFPTQHADPIPIKVLPRLIKPVVTPIEIGGPDSFFTPAPSAEVLSQWSPPTSVAELQFGVLIGLPLGCLAVLAAVYWPWRRRKLGELPEAATRALTELRAGSASPWLVLCRYLRERLHFDVPDATPREVARYLKRRGFALERCAQSEAFLQACDAVRYSVDAGASQALVDGAIKVIEALEADPCAR
jgi:hypothetical protein